MVRASRGLLGGVGSAKGQLQLRPWGEEGAAGAQVAKAMGSHWETRLASSSLNLNLMSHCPILRSTHRKKAETLSRHPALTGVRHVKLTDQRSAFW